MSDDRKAYHPAELPEHLKAAIRDATVRTEPMPPVLSVKPSEDGLAFDHGRDRLLRMAR